ncbi:hypothetical protein F444_21408 [Phytophthora nicotianae P1976]|uniref:Uncharacterized protein n=1 Tax=Phytophthora nicotianae P1976 TaxID=1317066 RepID=A0A080Z172_PHYNI|nr:hypothetical protein F444_21408 [Phytophthora nicotianae P1976]
MPRESAKVATPTIRVASELGQRLLFAATLCWQQCCHAWLYNSHLRQNKLAHARLHRTRKARFRRPAVMMSPLWWSSHAWDSHPNDRPAVGRRSSTAQGSTAPLPG